MDLMDWTIRGIMALLVAILVGLLGMMLFALVDSAGTRTEATPATVVSKSFTPAYTTTTMVMSGKVFVPITTYHPDSWSIRVNIDGNVISCPATEAQHDAAREGAGIMANVSQGRLSGNAYCGGVR